jgi:sugar O-acyltransferase (sialic acid O-acetyltransferase NeuD family)
MDRYNFYPVSSQFDPTAIIIYGAGGHGKTLIDLLRIRSIWHIVGLLDDGLAPGTQVLGIPVLGGAEKLPELYNQGVRLAVNGVGGIGNYQTRVKVFESLAQAGFTCPPAIHPTAWIEPSAIIEPGVQILPQAYIGSSARLGFGSVVNAGVIVSHDCTTGQIVNLSPGAMLAGDVHIGDYAQIGMGVTINLSIKIGERARVGNGATVKADVPPEGHVRAGTIWPISKPDGV